MDTSKKSLFIVLKVIATIAYFIFLAGDPIIAEHRPQGLF